MDTTVVPKEFNAHQAPYDYEPFFMVRIFWNTLGFAILGYIAKRMDAPRKEVRVQNFFAAAFTFVIGIMIADWLYIVSEGSVHGLREALVNEKQLGYGALHEANLIQELLLGYMVQDILSRLAYLDIDFEYGLHHLVCVIGLVQHLFFGHPPIFCVALAFGEFSTPVVCVMEIGQKEKSEEGYLLPSGILLNLLFPLRVFWFAWTHYLWTFEFYGSPLVTGDWSIYSQNTVGWYCSLVLLLLNIGWFYRLIRGTLQVLNPPKDKLE